MSYSIDAEKAAQTKKTAVKTAQASALYSGRKITLVLQALCEDTQMATMLSGR